MKASSGFMTHSGRTAQPRVDTMATAPSDGPPWTADEHQRFLDGLEKYGCGQSTSVFAAWHAITAVVRTRTLPEVKAHANHYYLQLQMINTQKRKEYLTMQHIDTRWTPQEDAALEAMLADHSDRVSFPWEELAARFRNKSARDLRDRYQKLCYDVARIEAGQHVIMHLGQQPRKTSQHNGIPLSTPRSQQSASETHSVDCNLMLTTAETELLLRALEQVPVPPRASPDVLTVVASAVAALACAKNKRPPQRTQPQFTLEDARNALEDTILMEPRDAEQVLEMLARDLHVLPTQTQYKLEDTMHGSHVNMTPRLASNLSPSASAYYLTSPPGLAKEDTRSAEDLLTLRTSPVSRDGFLQRSHADTVSNSVFSFTPSSLAHRPSPPHDHDGALGYYL
ncbi:hypothetical protein Poli38472_013573 [Pythium oligandrum]|uniref:Myb-like domain-containing protein n=1 Tax=Pythium oligandrum TaxID=41045 RepID=A0A8K1FF03_PYTOL|nr:hypothetical protein Poli38472_013573 [Pythium oligandrum]|eukprot:TMW61110.1 hypothetical protein Poli38472_013573 [Pythium oligandrum]